MANQTGLRISREITQIQQGSDLSITVACQEEDIRYARAQIIGPPDTPYEYGFFEFLVKFPSDYPLSPPKVDAKTTNRGRTRFNPNIYAGGKVCLSILGTWHGEKGEEWSSAQGLESVLLSIQSLMSNNPYENEPGYENHKSSQAKKEQEAYNAKIKHETIRIAVIQKLENMLRIGTDGRIIQVEVEELSSSGEDEEEVPEVSIVKDANRDAYYSKWEPFQDLQKRRFLWYYETYLSTIETEAPKFKQGEKFCTMPFEGTSNTMDGSFIYGELGRRLLRIKEVLNEETHKWAQDGLQETARESSTAFSLQGQFNTAKAFLRLRGIHNVDVNLHEGNPFVWYLTYFGKSGTNLEGGIWRIRVSLSPRFPDEQPRVKVETKMYHHRVSKDGTLCYIPQRSDEVKFHIESIVQTLEDESPPYDPRAIVRPEATGLLWGNADDRKKYGRLLRRSAQDSVEEADT